MESFVGHPSASVRMGPSLANFRGKKRHPLGVHAPLLVRWGWVALMIILMQPMKTRMRMGMGISLKCGTLRGISMPLTVRHSLRARRRPIRLRQQQVKQDTGHKESSFLFSVSRYSVCPKLTTWEGSFFFLFVTKSVWIPRIMSNKFISTDMNMRHSLGLGERLFQ